MECGLGEYRSATDGIYDRWKVGALSRLLGEREKGRQLHGKHLTDDENMSKYKSMPNNTLYSMNIEIMMMSGFNSLSSHASPRFKNNF